MPKRVDPPSTAWILHRVLHGEAEVIAVCSDAHKAQMQVERLIAKTLQKRSVKDLRWAPLPTGGRLLVYDRDGYGWQFRLEPWMVDSEVSA